MATLLSLMTLRQNLARVLTNAELDNNFINIANRIDGFYNGQALILNSSVIPEIGSQPSALTLGRTSSGLGWLQSYNGSTPSDISLAPLGGLLFIGSTTNNGSDAKLQVSGGIDSTNLSVRGGTGAIGYHGIWNGGGGPYDVHSLTANVATGEIKHYAYTNFFQTFYTNNTEKMRLDLNGSLLVGVTSRLATERLNITSPSSYTAVMSNTQNVNGDTCLYLNMQPNANTGASAFLVGNIASVGIRFAVAGNGDMLNVNNSYGAISARKLKQDIVDAGSQWNDIKALQLRKYHFKNDPNGFLQLGLIAEEAELVSPGLVNETPDYEERQKTDEAGNLLFELKEVTPAVFDEETNEVITPAVMEPDLDKPIMERVATGETTKSVKYSILYLKAVKCLQEAQARIERLEAVTGIKEAL